MNKKLLTIYSLFSFLTFSSSALAEPIFYAGIDANYQMLHADAYDPLLTSDKVSTSKYYNTKSFSPNFFAGFESGKNFKIELGYKENSTNQSAKDTVTYSGYRINTTTENELEVKAFSLDFRPYAKINDDFSIYGIAGLTHYDINLTQSITASNPALRRVSSGTDTGKIKKIAPTIGFGTEFKIAKNYFARTQIKYSYINETFEYTDGTKALNIKGATDLAIGAGFYF